GWQNRWSAVVIKMNYECCFISDVPVPNITVFRQMEDRERVIVMCSFGRMLIESSFQLSLKSKYNYTLKNPLCCSSEKCVFEVKGSPPVSFACVHQIDSVMNRQSETYTYSPSGKTYCEHNVKVL
uniref:Uncharacterized protein n=1 Tax=Sinocyclocheilus grahami TaxID=75366 RepID=A0A672PMD4_SINGR